MKLYPDSKVYVLCPGNAQTGGPEALHQLCSQLIRLNVNAFMFYISDGPKFNRDNPVHDFYRKYHLPHTFDIEDNERNVFVVPEYFSEYLYIVKKIRRVFWWLSVDNFIKKLSILIQNRISHTLPEPMPKFFYFNKGDDDIIHFVQSEYARQFVKINNIPDNRTYIVEDYLRATFLIHVAQVDLSKKKNIVAYNPKKGFEVTQQLIKLAPDIDWRPIQNMTPAQVHELLSSSKIYIDFGNHPGKDRIPREAAISGCVVITGKRGSAANDIDINIPDEFKFDISAKPQDIIKKIHDVFDNLFDAYVKQSVYRDRILNDKSRFTENVAEAFEIKNPPLLGVAIAQGVGYESFLLAQELYQSTVFKVSFIVDDALASAEISEKFIFREQNRNYLHLGENLIEIITQDDAKFLYLEGRINKFALLEPTDAELAELKDFYAIDDRDILKFSF